MTMEIYLVLLLVFSIVASFLTQGVKWLLDALKIKYASNLVAFGAALFTGSTGMACYYLYFGHPFTAPNVVLLGLMALSTWGAAMVGYDKAKQTIIQIMAIIKTKGGM